MLEVFTLCSILALLLLACYQRKLKRVNNLPPGPKPLPVFGNIPQLWKEPIHKLSEWAKQYGKMYTIYLGSKPVLVVNNMKTIKEIFGTMESTGKFRQGVEQLISEGYWGIVNSDGEAWQEQQRFCLSAMKKLGFSNSSHLDPIVMGDIDDLCAWIDEKVENGQNEELRIDNILIKQATNTIWNMITGERIKAKDSKMIQPFQNWAHALNVATKGGVTLAYWLRYIIPEKSGYNYFKRACRDVVDVGRAYFEKRKQARKLAGKSTPTELISACLEHVENCKDPNSAFYGEKGEKNSLHSVTMMLMGGSETTPKVINWLIFYLVVYPDVQKKLQKEIDQIIGKCRNPSIFDRKRMPYTDAVIMESLRYCSLVRFGSIHQLLDNLKYDDYMLPKGMILLANLFHANQDPEIWGDPEVFRPERFLAEDEDKRRFLRNSVATFQEGKRRCPGEQFSKDTMFLFTTKLFQKYDFFPQKGICTKDYLIPIGGYVAIPQSLGICVRPRTQ